MGRFSTITQTLGAISHDILPITSGGTAASTTAAAATNLGLLKASLKGAASGVSMLGPDGLIRVEELNTNVAAGLVKLDANGKIPPARVRSNVASGLARLDATGKLPGSIGSGVKPMIQGLTRMAVNQSSTFLITNYDFTTTYSVTANGGSVYRNGDTITYTAPGSVNANAGFTINGRTFVVNVTANFPKPATIAAPGQASVNQLSAFTITVNAFGMSYGAGDTHLNTSWQLATDPGFTNIVLANYDNATDKLTWTVSGLTANTTYYVRARFAATTAGYGDWGDSVMFRTTSDFLPNLEYSKLIPSDGVAGDFFGRDVAISGDKTTVAIGACFSKYTPNNVLQAGAVYIYVRSGSTWTLQSKIYANAILANMLFGRAVSLSQDGNTLIITAPGAKLSGQYGRFYVYKRTGTTWAFQYSSFRSDEASNDGFGWDCCLSADGNTAVSASNAEAAFGTTKNAVYVFFRTGTSWAQQAKLVPSDVTTEYVARNVTISGDGNTLAFGVHDKSETFTNQGAVYVFTRSGTTWTQVAKVLHSDPAATDYFGYNVALSSNGLTMAVAAPLKTNNGSQMGAVYIFTRVADTWTQEAKLLSSDITADDTFGMDLAISNDGNILMVGSSYKDLAYVDQGSVYVFTRSGASWSQRNVLTPSTPLVKGRFGQGISMSLDGSMAVVSCIGDNAATGAAYLFV